MPESEAITGQQQLLATNRRALAVLLQQQAKFGAYVPTYVVLSIEETRAEIQRVKAVLRDWLVEIENLPDDDSSMPVLSKMQQASIEFDALLKMMQLPEVYAAVAVYRSHFEDTGSQIRLIIAYKELHDLLQQIEDRHRILVRFCKSLLNAADAWYDLEENEPELYDKAGELLARAADTLLAEETSTWIARLAHDRQDLRTALETRDDQRLRDTLRHLKRIVDQQLSRTNMRMSNSAGKLHLSSLAEALQQISAYVAVANQARLDDFHHSVTALRDLDEQLTGAVRLHSAFQDLDDELRRVEGALDGGMEELISAWPDIAPISQAICADNTAEWAIQMHRLCVDVEQALAGDTPRLRRAFGRYRSNTNVCFNRVDYNLRDLCAELHYIGAPLASILKVFA